MTNEFILGTAATFGTTLARVRGDLYEVRHWYGDTFAVEARGTWEACLAFLAKEVREYLLAVMGT